jgi:hypothetical protein
MELDQKRIEDAIVREVADKIIGEDDLYERVKRAVEDRIDRHFKTTADAQIHGAIEAAITQGFEREYQRVDSFGRREGERTTIRAELEKMIGGYWNQKVDRTGQPSTAYGADMTRAEWLMTKLVASDFQKDMKQHVVNLGGALKDKLRLELHETVNRLLTEVFHVRTPDDEIKKRQDQSIIHPKQTV